MLESVLDFKEINQKPYLMFLWAFIMSTVGILISTQVSIQISVSQIVGGPVPLGSDFVFSTGGLFAVLFTILPSVYFITHLIKKEELLEEKCIIDHKNGFWTRQGKDILILLFYFFGVSMSFAFWAFFLPENFFQVQIAKIHQIHGLSGAVTGQEWAAFNSILFNNIQVLLFSFAFSFIFGAGAIFIIAWNASVLGVFVGNKLSQYIWHIPLATLPYLPHAIPEISGYVCAGLAGGLISASVLRKQKCEVFRVIFFDSFKLLAMGTVFIFLGAGIESLNVAYQTVCLVLFYSLFMSIIINAIASKA